MTRPHIFQTATFHTYLARHSDTPRNRRQEEWEAWAGHALVLPWIKGIVDARLGPEGKGLVAIDTASSGVERMCHIGPFHEVRD